MKEQTLMEVGFSKNEAKVYVSLLETGPASATKVAEVSGIHRVNVYDAIEKLKERGLVGFLQNNGKRVFQASSPDTLLSIPKNMEMKIKNLLPELQLKTQLSPQKSEVGVFSGSDFFRNKMLEFLDVKKDILAFGIPPYVVLKVLGKDWVEAYHLRRRQGKQTMYHLYNYGARDRVGVLNGMPYTKARYVKAEHDQTVETIICDNRIMIIAYPEDEDPKKLITIYMTNEQIANAYAKYFWILWERGDE